MKAKPLIIERTINASVEKIWEAITDRNKMQRWYFDINSFKPEVGFEFEFTAASGDRKFRHLCKITAVEENKKLAYTWKYADYPGESIVTFELFPEGDKTKLKFTHDGLETFAANDADFKRESFTAGWNHIIGISLNEFVEK